jgi:Uncharacterized protein conserved in bacteria (DUF2314)
VAQSSVTFEASHIKIPRSEIRRSAQPQQSQTKLHLKLSLPAILAFHRNRLKLGDDGLIFCSVGEAPDALHLSKGASFVVAGESIEDWMINHGGTAFGGFSLRVIRSRLCKEEQMKFDVHTGIREFGTLAP